MYLQNRAQRESNQKQEWEKTCMPESIQPHIVYERFMIIKDGLHSTERISPGLSKDEADPDGCPVLFVAGYAIHKAAVHDGVPNPGNIGEESSNHGQNSKGQYPVDPVLFHNRYIPVNHNQQYIHREYKGAG